MKKSIKVNALLNMIKQIMQIIFPIITMPYITRVLLPENYGKINTGNSIISYVSLIAGLGIGSYAIREGSLIRHNRDELTTFSNQVFSINIISTVFSYFILGCVMFLIPHYNEYRMLLAIQGVSVIFTTLGTEWINSIEEDYVYLTIRYIILHIISLVLMFAFVKKTDDYLIYALIMLLTSVGGNILNIFYVRKYVRIRFTLAIDWKKHILPILILFGNSVAITIYVSSDITMLELFCGANEVGVYSVATKIYTIIKQVINAILIVSIPRLTSYIGTDNKSGFISLNRKILNVLFTLLWPIVFGLIFLRREAIQLVGGVEYSSGESSLLILSMAIVFALLATYLSSCILMPLRKEKIIAKGTLISASLNVILNFIFIPLWGGNGAALTTLISELFIAFYLMHIVRREGHQYFDVNLFVIPLVGGLFVAITIIVIRALVSDFIMRIVLSILISGSIYFFIQVVGKNPVISETLVRMKELTQKIGIRALRNK